MIALKNEARERADAIQKSLAGWQKVNQMIADDSHPLIKERSELKKEVSSGDGKKLNILEREIEIFSEYVSATIDNFEESLRLMTDEEYWRLECGLFCGFLKSAEQAWLSAEQTYNQFVDKKGAAQARNDKIDSWSEVRRLISKCKIDPMALAVYIKAENIEINQKIWGLIAGETLETKN